MAKLDRSEEVLNLSEEILTDFELNRLPITHIILKCKRLARIENDFEAMKWFELELNGYNSQSLPNGISVDDGEKCARRGGRFYFMDIPTLGNAVGDIGNDAKKDKAGAGAGQNEAVQLARNRESA